jgi:hypothetical protein
LGMPQKIQPEHLGFRAQEIAQQVIQSEN